MPVPPAIAGMADDVALAAMRTAQAKPQAAAKQASKGFDLDSAENAFNMGFMALLPVQLAGALGLTRVLHWARDKTGVGAFGKVAKGIDAANTATLADIGRATGVGAVIRPVAEIGMKPVALFADAMAATGFTSWRANANAAKAASHIQSLTPHLNALQTLHAGGSLDPASHAAVGEVLNVMAKDPSHWAAAAEHGAAETAFATAFKNANAALSAARHKPGSNALAAVEKHAGKAHLSNFLADGYKNLPHYARTKAVDGMARANFLHAGINNTAFLAFGGFSAYRTGRDLKEKIGALKQVYAVLAGKKEQEVGAWEALSASVPGEGGKMLHQIRLGLTKEFGPSVLAEFGNTANNLRMTVSSKLGSIMAQIAFGMASPMWRSVVNEKALPAYMALKAAERSRAPIPEAMFTEALGALAPDLARLGGAKSNFTAAVSEMYAREYAAGRIRVDGIVQEIGNGTLLKRIDAIQHAHQEVKKEAHAAQAAHSTHEEKWREHLNKPQPAGFRERQEAHCGGTPGVGARP